MDTKTAKKRSPSSFQKINTLQKKVENYKTQGLPTVKEAMHIRSLALSTMYLERLSDPEKPPITMEKFCSSNSINVATLRKGIRELTGETKKKASPSSNNIKSYQNNVKFVKDKVLTSGVSSLSLEEKEFYEKYQAKETRRLEAVQERRLQKANASKDLALRSKTLLSPVDSSHLKVYEKVKDKKQTAKGGSKGNESSESEYSDEEEDIPSQKDKEIIKSLGAMSKNTSLKD